MSDPFVSWYLSSDDPLVVLKRLQGAGLSLDAPGRQDVVSLLDLEGDQVPKPRVEFEVLARSRDVPSVTFQMWFSDSEDVVVTCFREHEMTGDHARLCIVAYLDGLTESQEQHVASAMELSVVDQPDDTVALIVDLTGASEGFNWLEAIEQPIAAHRVDRLTLNRRLFHGERAGLWTLDSPAPGLATRTWS